MILRISAAVMWCPLGTLVSCWLSKVSSTCMGPASSSGSTAVLARALIMEDIFETNNDDTKNDDSIVDSDEDEENISNSEEDNDPSKVGNIIFK